MGPLRYSQAQKIMENAGTCLHVDYQIEYLPCQGQALHLVRPARYGVLWAVKTEWNHHRGFVSNAIDAFQPSIEGETATVLRETRQSYLPAWQCSVICRKIGQDILGNAEMGGITQPFTLTAPDVTPSVYHLFRSMADRLGHQHFCSY